MAMELNKENIEYEHLLSENSADTVVKAEYVIPDTHPDVSKILMVDSRPTSVKCEIMQDKVYFEGQINYVILYLAKEDGKDGIHSVNYNGQFSNYIDMPGIEHKMSCYPECLVEHMGCTIVNERKIAVEGIINTKARVYKNYRYEIVKDITSSDEVQLLKAPVMIDKVVGSVNMDLNGKAQLHIPMEKPQISSILKCNVRLHRREVNVIEGKVSGEAFAFVEVIYTGASPQDIQYISDDVLLKNEMDIEGAAPSMNVFSNFKFEDINLGIKDDDLGESRILDVEISANAFIQVLSKETIDMVEDAYSPACVLNINRKEHELDNILTLANTQVIVKDNIEVNDDMKPAEIIMCEANLGITDKKLLEDKVNVEGVIKASVIYRTSGEEPLICAVEQEFPFSTVIEAAGAKIDMQCTCRAYMESLDAYIEAGTIGIKGVIAICGKVSYKTHKEFIEDISTSDDELPHKKASIIIYVVQPGDTLWKIAKKYCTTTELLLKLNNIENPDLTVIGQKLIIPGRAVL